MPAEKNRDAGPDDVKAKFKEALERKHGNKSGAVDSGHAPEPKAQHNHGPEGKRGFIRRKTG